MYGCPNTATDILYGAVKLPVPYRPPLPPPAVENQKSLILSAADTTGNTPTYLYTYSIFRK